MSAAVLTPERVISKKAKLLNLCFQRYVSLPSKTLARSAIYYISQSLLPSHYDRQDPSLSSWLNEIELPNLFLFESTLQAKRTLMTQWP